MPTSQKVLLAMRKNSGVSNGKTVNTRIEGKMTQAD